jgi:alpha-tubulin suppressor-like RCC1 family protein
MFTQDDFVVLQLLINVSTRGGIITVSVALFTHRIDGQLAVDVKENGDVAEPMLIESMTRVEKIATGGSFTLCLTEDGQVYSWGVGSDLLTGSTEAHVPHVVNELNGRFVQDIICGETFSYAMLV